MGDENEFLNYNKAIFEFEDFLEKLNDDKNIELNKKRIGYLIELIEFEELQNNFNHKKLKKKELKKGEWENYFDKGKFNKIKKIKPFEIKSYQYFINMLLNKNEYILITDNLFEIICEKQYKYQSNVIYSIDKSNIYIYFEDKNKLTISNLYKNKINDYTLSIKEADKKSFDKFENLLESMVIYNKFEKKFIDELKKPKPSSSIGNNAQCNYLINKVWLDEWIYFSDYNNIKETYFRTNLDLKKDKNIKQEIINKLIEHQEEYKNTYKLNKLKILEFKNKEEIESYLKYNSFVIVDYNFKIKYSYEKKDVKNINILNNKITIDINSKNKLTFNSENNIITNNEYNYLKELRQLIRIFCFQEELQKLFFESSKQNEIKKAYYLVNSNIILEYKKYYDYDILYNYLKNNHDILNEITDKKNNINYSKLLEDKIMDSIINKLDIQHINKVKEKISYKGPLFNNEDFKINEVENKRIKYISDFAIINYDILFYFLQTNIIEEEKFIYANFLFGNNRILISFKNNNNIFNEIGILDENQNFIIEYLFETQIKDIYKKITENNSNNFLSMVFVNQKGDFTFDFKTDKDKNNNNQNKDFNNIKFYKIQNIENIEKRNNEIKQKEKEKEKINSNSNHNKNETENKQFIFNNISSILLSFLLFNNNLNKEIEQNKTFKSYNGYIINKKILSEYKKLFLFEKIFKYFTTNEKKEGNIYNFIEENKNYYSKLNQNMIINLFKDDNCLNPNMKEIKVNNESVSFPEEFSIISDTIYVNLSKFYKLKNGNKINYYFSKSWLVLKYDNSNNFNNCIIICSSRIDENKNVTFSPIFKFIYFNEEEMNKEFHNLYNNINVDNFLEGNDIIKNGNIIGLCYSLKDLKEIKENDDKLKMYLNIWIEIYKGCSNLKDNIKNTYEKCNYYIINKKLFNNFKKIFYYKEISDIINNFKKQIDENIIDLINENLNDKVKNDLNNLNEEKIKKYLFDKDGYKLEIKKYKINKNSYLDYYNNCQIINEKLLKYIQIYAGISFEIKKVECILSDEFCIIKSDNDFSINIGILDESNIFIVKNLITSNTSQNINEVFSTIKKKRI